ncbi:CDP-alcohol phosphatidyltransferase family protein [Demequina aurantiaca]|uniref:CDP-alcohol phosphatidyltransferase family protein n=1 Tax=Demequina aurantiaca TaxID=676200 RepID=UPI003D338453
MSDAPRPEHPSIDQIREVCQPDSIRNRTNAEHWTADLFTRSISPYLTRAFVRAGISANGVTVVMILCGWAAAAAFFIPGIAGPIIAAFLAVLQMLLDSSDGEVARWNRKMGPRGIFLDRIAHTTTESLIPIAIGLRLTLESDDGNWAWAFVGAVLGALVLVNKSLKESSRMALVESGLSLPKKTDARPALRAGWIATARRAANFVPIHRAYHSVEQTLVVLAFAIVGLIAGFNGVAVALIVLAIAAPIVIAGHLLAILSSSLLRNPEQ